MTETAEEKPMARKGFWHSKGLHWGLGIFGGLILLLFIASFFLDEPLRRMTEKKLNSHLKGYSVHIKSLHLQLVGLSVTLKGVAAMQQAYPDPPIANLPYLKASIRWSEILHGKVVAEIVLDKPKLSVNLEQLRSEVKEKKTVKERGWQQAIESIYPLKINSVIIKDADITYIDEDIKKPLSLTHFNFQATNIRNVRSPDKVYPSSFEMDTYIFGSGHGRIEGQANVLSEPLPGIKATFKFEKIPIDFFKPIIARANLSIHSGTLETTGNVEFGPETKTARVENLTIAGMKVDYIHSAASAAKEKGRAGQVGKSAKKVSNKPGILLRVDQMNLKDCTVGMINKDATPAYRVFLSDLDFNLTNFSNHFSQGPAHVKMNAKFMGNGLTNATARFRPEKKGPDLDLYVKINDTQMTSLNQLLRAYGKFDVTAGVFSLVTELHVKNDVVTGYLKPFFRDMKVYDKRQDKEKGVFRKMYEMLVGGVSKLLENRPRAEVATKADISGPLEKPQTSTWQVLVQLVRNAFFKAILPTFERELSGSKKG
ncbi:MAG TPA: DUF748 domain-containing protein [Desulfuromonadaceae bacterium]|jgi:hypothetical protein